MTVTRERLMAAADQFPLREAHAMVADLMQPDMRRYRIDLAVTALTGWAAVAVLTFAEPVVVKVVAWAAATWLLYRAALFIHELVHLRRAADVAAFAPVWNALVGYPLLIPHFLYACHAEHHSKRLYGTVGDAEYLPFAQLPRSEIVRVVLLSPVSACYGPARFGLLAPLAWLSPRVRRWSWQRASAIKLDLSYEGHPPRNAEQRRTWLRQEVIATALCWTVVTAAALGWVPWALLGWWLVVVASVVVLNTFRLLGAHRYHGNDDEDATLLAQMIDTVNVTRRPRLSAVWGPIGLRLHALHHLFPGLPYHAYPAAHERLVAGLPAGSAYHLTEERGLTAALLRLWRAPRPNQPRRTP